MILPIETDDALDALRKAREAIGAALDELNHQGAPWEMTVRFEQAHSGVATFIEQIAAVIRIAGIATYMEGVEERHVSAQIFPHMDDL